MEALKQFVREALRLIAVAVVSYLATAGVLDQVVRQFGGSLSPEVQVMVMGLLTITLKSVDRMLHETGMAEKGLVRM